LGKIAELCSYLIIVAASTSAARLGITPVGFQDHAAKAASVPLLCAGSLQTLLAMAQVYSHALSHGAKFPLKCLSLGIFTFLWCVHF
jgi:hypothetical protein